MPKSNKRKNNPESIMIDIEPVERGKLDIVRDEQLQAFKDEQPVVLQFLEERPAFQSRTFSVWLAFRLKYGPLPEVTMEEIEFSIAFHESHKGDQRDEESLLLWKATAENSKLDPTVLILITAFRAALSKANRPPVRTRCDAKPDL